MRYHSQRKHPSNRKGTPRTRSSPVTESSLISAMLPLVLLLCLAAAVSGQTQCYGDGGCAYGYVCTSAGFGTCYYKPTYLGATCYRDVHCQSIDIWAECRYGVCRCKSQYWTSGNECTLSPRGHRVALIVLVYTFLPIAIVVGVIVMIVRYQRRRQMITTAYTGTTTTIHTAPPPPQPVYHMPPQGPSYPPPPQNPGFVNPGFAPPPPVYSNPPVYSQSQGIPKY